MESGVINFPTPREVNEVEYLAVVLVATLLAVAAPTAVHDNYSRFNHSIKIHLPKA
jgi:hypothetical protein